MVSFRNIVAMMALAAPVMAQTTPAQVVTNIKLITQKSQALQAPAEKISLLNGPLIIIGLGPFPQIITGFVDIVTTTTVALTQMNGMRPVPAGADSDAIFNAFREFVRVHQVLLNILIGKAGLFNTVPLIGTPIAAVLRQIEKIVDSVAFALIDAVQSRATDIQTQAKSLTGTVTSAIDAFDGLSLSKRDAQALPISRVRRAEIAV
ncbi:hypothetical protein WAI453_002997 [Rhynchosporium graminicola]|uniref:UVI-1 protein n=2 Tax=Rhynchosporium TaxID=38037 RepID=A0A1E1M1G8_RHYSE|nr:uncharacterized protein RCO7_02288 [Rhynchosporium commune]CZT42918.1 uncharacterized protein RSE6_02878 [Rhynchosporium secalis]